MKIAIEGPPGSYKHVIASELGKRLSVTAPSRNRDSFNWLLKNMRINARRWVFTTMLSGIMGKTAHTDVAVGTPETALRCYSAICAVSTGEAQLLTEVAKCLHRTPEVTVYIKANEDQCMRRLQQREENWILDQEDTWNKITTLCKSYETVMSSRKNVIEVPALDYRNDPNLDMVIGKLRSFFPEL
jgi:nucleoside-triphosphatase THEP1